MNNEKFEALGKFFSELEVEFDVAEIAAENKSLKDVLEANPTTLSDREINLLNDFGIANAAHFLSESATDSTNSNLLKDLSSQAMDQAFVLWELEPTKSFSKFYIETLKSICEKRLEKGRSDEVLLKIAKEYVFEYASQQGSTLDKKLCVSMAHECLFEAVNEIKDDGNESSFELIKKLTFSKLCKAADELIKTIVKNEREERLKLREEASEHKINSDKSKVISRIANLKNSSEIDAEMYEELLHYAKANVSRFASASKQENPSPDEIEILAKEAISDTTVKFDKNISKESGAKFTTYLVWNIRTVLAKRRRFLYSDRLKKNSMPGEGPEINDELSPDEIKEIKDGGYMDSELLGNEVERERVKKLHFGMRQIRHELPRATNHYIDLKMGDILKSDGTPFSTRAYCEMIGIERKGVEKIQADGLKIIKAKLVRKGFIEIIDNTEASLEDMHKSQQVSSAVLSEEEANAIMSTVVRCYLLEELTSTLYFHFFYFSKIH